MTAHITDRTDYWIYRIGLWAMLRALHRICRRAR